MTELELRQKYVKSFADLVGKCAEGSANHKALLDTYNTLKPLPRGAKMLESYDWCACTVTALAIRCGLADIFAKECSCTKQIEQWRAMGAWVENDAYIPKMGDIIYYAWADGTNYKTTDFSNDVDHVGVVEKVENGYIYSIEGNKANNVNRRTIAINGRYIRGFAVPKYAKLAVEDKPKFADIAESGYKSDIEWAASLGIANGYTDGTFKPNEPCTRGQMCAFLHRLYNALKEGK